MANVLEKIVADKRIEIAQLKIDKPLASFIDDLKPTTKDMYAALDRKQGKSQAGFILECKKASPSKGLIRADFDPKAICEIYDKYAAAISVLTDEKYFQGKFEYLKIVTDTVSCPVLNKDFFNKEQVKIFTGEIIKGLKTNLNEDIVDLYKTTDIKLSIKDTDGYPLKRLAHDFEALRLKLSLKQLKLVLVNVGELKAIAARSSFCKNYFEVAGIEVETIHFSKEEFMKTSFDSNICICATDENLSSLVDHFETVEKKLSFVSGKSIKKDGLINKK